MPSALCSPQVRPLTHTHTHTHTTHIVGGCLGAGWCVGAGLLCPAWSIGPHQVEPGGARALLLKMVAPPGPRAVFKRGCLC